MTEPLHSLLGKEGYRDLLRLKRAATLEVLGFEPGVTEKSMKRLIKTWENLEPEDIPRFLEEHKNAVDYPKEELVLVEAAKNFLAKDSGNQS